MARLSAATSAAPTRAQQQPLDVGGWSG